MVITVLHLFNRERDVIIIVFNSESHQTVVDNFVFRVYVKLLLRW